MNSLEIPEPIMTAAVGMLKPFSPGLTAEKLLGVLGGAADTGDALLTVGEASVALNVSVRTINRMLEPGGTLERVRVRGAVRIRRSAVNKIVRASA